jgi:hypothetical protein
MLSLSEYHKHNRLRAAFSAPLIDETYAAGAVFD